MDKQADMTFSAHAILRHAREGLALHPAPRRQHLTHHLRSTMHLRRCVYTYLKTLISLPPLSICHASSGSISDRPFWLAAQYKNRS